MLGRMFSIDFGWCGAPYGGVIEHRKVLNSQELFVTHVMPLFKS